MRYELDTDGYIKNVYFNCYTGKCSLYEGNIPDGYNTLEEWSENANIQAYNLVEGNLTYDATRETELEEEYEIQCGILDNSLNFILFCSSFQGGVATITPIKKKTETTLEITFKKQFKTIPIVVLTAASSLTDCHYSNKSLTGMTIHITSETTDPVEIDWLAIGKN